MWTTQRVPVSKRGGEVCIWEEEGLHLREVVCIQGESASLEREVCICRGLHPGGGGLHSRGGKSASQGRGICTQGRVSAPMGVFIQGESGSAHSWGRGLHPGGGGGLPNPRGTGKAGGTHLTEMLSCFNIYF